MKRLLFVPFLLLPCLAAAAPALSLNDLWFQAWGTCGSTPCLTIQQVQSSGPWAGKDSLNDRMFQAFGTCGGSPCLLTSVSGTATLTSLSVTNLSVGTATAPGCSGCEVLANNSALQWLDAGGVTRNILQLDSGNNFTMTSAPTGNFSMVPATNLSFIVKNHAQTLNLLLVQDGTNLVTIQQLANAVNALGTVGASATITIGNGDVVTLTSTASTNMTLTPSNGGNAGQHLDIIIASDATGGDVITFAAPFKPTGTMTLTASKRHTIRFVSDGVNWYEQGRTTNL